jgi:hypothetical protein
MLKLLIINTTHNGKPYVMLGVGKASDEYMLKELLKEDIRHLLKNGFNPYDNQIQIPQSLLKQILQ